MSLHCVELSKMFTTTLCAAGSFSSYEERATGRDGCYGLTVREDTLVSTSQRERGSGRFSALTQRTILLIPKKGEPELGCVSGRRTPAGNLGNKSRRRQPGLGCKQPGQPGRRRDLSWRKEWTPGPGRREPAGKETLPARVHPVEPRWTWWTQPASPTLRTQGERRSFSEELQA